jgi:hypothetical protein
VPVGTAEKNGIEIRARKSGATFVSVMSSRSPRTRIPVAFVALPAITALAPTMSSTNDAAGDCILGFSERRIAYAKFDAVTGVPLEKRNPFLIRNV